MHRCVEDIQPCHICYYGVKPVAGRDLVMILTSITSKEVKAVLGLIIRLHKRNCTKCEDAFATGQLAMITERARTVRAKLRTEAAEFAGVFEGKAGTDEVEERSGQPSASTEAGGKESTIGAD